jgi:hypothetical protein
LTQEQEQQATTDNNNPTTIPGAAGGNIQPAKEEGCGTCKTFSVYGPPDFPVWHLVIDNCFGKPASQQILRHFGDLKDRFDQAHVSEKRELNTTYRTNRTCFMDPLTYHQNCYKQNSQRQWVLDKEKWYPHRALVSPLLRHLDAFVRDDMTHQLLDHAPLPICKFRQFDYWETQVSRYGDNRQFYTWHQDRLPGQPDRRIVSIVYYVHSDPKRFTGGQLHLSNGLVHGGKIYGNPRTVALEPRNDRMVIFPSRAAHMVAPTDSPPEWEAGRFSVNCWVGYEAFRGDLY